MSMWHVFEDVSLLTICLLLFNRMGHFQNDRNRLCYSVWLFHGTHVLANMIDNDKVEINWFFFMYIYFQLKNFHLYDIQWDFFGKYTWENQYYIWEKYGWNKCQNILTYFDICDCRLQKVIWFDCFGNFQCLKQYMFIKLSKIVDQIKSMNVELKTKLLEPLSKWNFLCFMEHPLYI